MMNDAAGVGSYGAATIEAIASFRNIEAMRAIYEGELL
jgi:hypothetical protein